MFNFSEVVKHKKIYKDCHVIMDYHADYGNSAKNWISLNILHKIIRKRVLCSALKYIEKIYPVVPASAVFLNEVYGIPFENMELLPLGCDFDKTKEIIIQNRGDLIRKGYSISKDDFVIFTGGKLDRIKRTDLLIKAILALADPRLHLIIVGKIFDDDIFYKENLRHLIDSNDKIHFAGWINGEDVYDYMHASDIAIFPASQSVMWNQSVGMALPLILGLVAEVRGRLIKQDLTFLNQNNNVIFLDETKTVDEERIQDLLMNIKSLMDNPCLLENMKQGAMKTAEEYLNYNMIAHKTLECLGNIEYIKG
jgi:glycosyltransferase involved in cell wall biosynthesis